MADLANDTPAAPPTTPPGVARPRSSVHLFWAFTWLAMQGFGGVLAVAQKELCDRRRWLTHTEFLELLGTAQVMPGPNVCNLSIMIGDRFFGWRGACAALGGMIALPMALMLVLPGSWGKRRPRLKPTTWCKALCAASPQWLVGRSSAQCCACPNHWCATRWA